MSVSRVRSAPFLPSRLQPKRLSFRDGNAEIYKMDADGSGEQRLTTSSGTDESPTWSPDDRWIAFVGETDGSFDLFVMRSDGSELRALTRTRGDQLAPAWSPTLTSAVARRALATELRDRRDAT